MSTRLGMAGWSLAGLSVAMFAASVALFLLPFRSSQWHQFSLTVSGMLVSMPFLTFPLVGALIASRRPHNPIGWILLAHGFLQMILSLFGYYSEYGLAVRISSVSSGDRRAGLVMWVPTVGLLGIYLPLLFPDGKLPSRRWRPLVWLSVCSDRVVSVTEGLTPGPSPIWRCTQPVRA